MYCNSMSAEGIKGILKIIRWPVSRVDKLTIFTCRLSCNMAAPTYGNFHILCKHLGVCCTFTFTNPTKELK